MKLFWCSILTIMILSGCGGPKIVVRPEVDAHGQRAHRHFLNGDLDKAAAHYKRGYAAARKVDDVSTAARYLANAGRVHAEMGLHDSASLYLARAHAEFVALSDTAAASRTAASIAVSTAALGDIDMAKQWYAAAAAYSDNGSAAWKHHLAVIKARMDWYQSSQISEQAALDEAMSYYAKKKNRSVMATIYILMADAEIARGNCTAAAKYLTDALSSVGKTRELYRRSGILLKLSAIKFCAGDADAGRHYYERARDSAPRGAAAVPPIEEVPSCDINCR